MDRLQLRDDHQHVIRKRACYCPGMASGESELEQAERHVREGERHVAVQREIVRHLAEAGESTKIAIQRLRQFEDLLELHRQHLERLRNRP
jgi:hypothetical protein